MREMQKVLISFDPLVLDTIERMAKLRMQVRAELIRDILYTAVWNEKKTGEMLMLRRAPTMPRRMIDDPNQFRVLRIAGECHRSVSVDEFGLAIDPPQYDTPWGLMD